MTKGINLSVVQKISLGFALLVTICLGLVALGLLMSKQTNERFSEYQSSVKNLETIGFLESNIAELQRQILAYRLSSSALAIEDMKKSLSSIEDNVQQIKNIQLLKTVNKTDIIDDVNAVVKEIANNINNLESQRLLWLEADNKKRALMEAGFNQLNLISQTAHSPETEPYTDELSIKLFEVENNSLRYFISRQRQYYNNTIKQLETSKQLTQNFITTNATASQIKVLTEFQDLLTEINLGFIRAVQADRNFIFLVNVVIAGNTTELRSLSHLVKKASEDYQEAISSSNAHALNVIRDYLVLGSTILLLIALVSAVLITQDLVIPIKQITDVFNQLGRGKPVEDIPEIKRNDEIGQLAQAANIFRQTSEKTKQLLSQSEKLTQELKQREATIKKSNEELDSFAYVASHDLKSPLRAIFNLANWIEEDCHEILPEPSKKHLGLLKSRISRMENLLNDILLYSRSGRVETEIKTIKLSEIIEEAILLVHKPESFEFHLLTEMPEITARVSPLTQVFQNLFSNAVKYNDKSPGKVFLSCDNSDEQYVEITVKDNGIGIAEEFYDRVFLMFHTLHSRDQIEASGIGLSIIKKILDNEGGTIRIESKVGEGTSFIFMWPKKPIELTSQ